MNTEVKLATTLDALSRQKTGEAKRDQVIKIKPEVLMIEDGFNVRGVGMSEDEYWNLPHVVEHVESIALAYTNGEYVPAIVVKWDAEKQRALIRDGHHRYRALMLSIERGAPIQFIKVEQISGDESNQQLLMFKSGNSLELTPVEKAEIIHRLISYGFEPQQIADKIGKSITYVSHMLKVYDLPIAKKRLIQQGKLTVNKALTPPADLEKVAKRKANRQATNKMMDHLIASEKVEIEDGIAKVSIPLELWEAFKLAQIQNKEEQDLEEAVKAFEEKQEHLPLGNIA